MYLDLFKDIKNRKLCFLAPMADITDAAFRRLIKSHFNVDLLFTEMVSARGIYEKDRKTLDIARIYNWDRPIFIQIFGSDPFYLSYAAKYLQDRFRPDGIDINAGCPVKKVLKSGSGAALLQDLKLLDRILKSVVESVDIPVSLKIRLGPDINNYNAVEVAKIAKDNSIAFLSVHGRFTKQMYRGKANWNLIYNIKENVDIKLIGNGDLFSLEDILQKDKLYPDIDGYMIARGILKNLALTDECINKAKSKFLTDLDFRFSLIEKHFKYLIELYKDRALFKFKKFFAWYISGLPYNHIYKERFFLSESIDDGFKIIQEYYNFLKNYKRN